MVDKGVVLSFVFIGIMVDKGVVLSFVFIGIMVDKGVVLSFVFIGRPISLYKISTVQGVDWRQCLLI